MRRVLHRAVQNDTASGHVRFLQGSRHRHVVVHRFQLARRRRGKRYVDDDISCFVEIRTRRIGLFSTRRIRF